MLIVDQAEIIFIVDVYGSSFNICKFAPPVIKNALRVGDSNKCVCLKKSIYVSVCTCLCMCPCFLVVIPIVHGLLFIFPKVISILSQAS